MELDEKTDELLNTSTLEISPEFLGIIAEIDEFKGAWKAVGRLAPDRLTSLRRVATIESIASSTRIEGATLSNREVERLLRDLSIERLASQDEQEVAGYAEVTELVFDSFQSIHLTENIIKQLHRDLLKYSSKDERHRGQYKTLSNNVEAFGADGESLGVIFTTASPFETPRRMSELVKWTQMQLSTDELHPLLVVAVFTVVFLEIHPFQDGNGRLSRILSNLLLLRAGYTFLPYCSLESVIEQSKELYYRALRETQATIRTDMPNWTPWVQFFLRALQSHKRHLELKIEEELQVISSLPELSVQLVERVRVAGRITMADAVRLTGASRNTIKGHFKSLVQSGILVRHGAGRGTWYSLA